MNRSTGILIIIIAIALTAGGLSYWTGFLSTETGSGTGTEIGSELLEIVNVSAPARKSGYLDLTIRNGGTRDARLEYIVANGSVVNEEDHIIPYGSELKIEIQIPLSFEPNSLVILRLHTESGRDFEEIIIIPEPPGIPNIEIPTGYAEAVEDGWEIFIDLKNTGSGDTVIDHIFVNNGAYPYPELPLSLDSGTTVRLKILLSSGSSGTAISIKIHTSDGHSYPVMVRLP